MISQRFLAFHAVVRARLEAARASEGEDVPTAPVDVARALVAHLDRRFSDADPDTEPIAAARFAAVAVADEILLHEPWHGQAGWGEHLLEAAVFASRGAGDVIFERVDALLAHPHPDPALAELYAAVLATGFQGRYRGKEWSTERRQLLSSLLRAARAARPDAITPDAVHGAIRGLEIEMLPPVRWLFWAVLVAPLAVGVGLSAQWWSYIRQVQAAATAIGLPASDPGALRISAGSLFLVTLTATSVAALHFAVASPGRGGLRAVLGRWMPGPAGGPRAVGLAAARALRVGSRLGSEEPDRVPLILQIGDADLASGVRLRLAAPPPASDADRLVTRHYDRGALLGLGPETYDSPELSRCWQRLVQEVERARPGRPADAIVLALPAPRLLDPEATSKTAEQLAAWVADAQRHLGMQLPVYVVVTELDALVGGAELVAGLERSAHGQLVGWSRSNRLTAPYDETETREALAHVAEAFRGACLCTAEAGAAGPALVLPLEVADLTEGILATLDAVFRQTAYREPPTLRGVYFSGRSPDGNAVFVHELFKRVLSEHGVATPVEGASLRRRRLRVAYGLALGAIAAIGLIAAAWIRGEMEPRATDVSRMVDALREAPEGQRIEGTVEALANVSTAELACPAAPASWFVHADERVAWALAGPVDTLIGAIEGRLQVDATALAEAPLPTDPPGTLLEDTDIVGRAERFHAEKLRLESACRSLAEFFVHKEIDALADAITDTFGRPVPPSFRSNSAFYSDAIDYLSADATQCALAVDAASAAPVAEALLTAALENGALAVRGERVAERMLELGARPSHASLQALERAIVALEEATESPESDWMALASPSARAIPPLADLRPWFSVQEPFAERHRRVQRELDALEALGAPLLERGERYRLSPPVAALRAALTRFLRAEGPPQPMAPQGWPRGRHERVEWDHEVLAEQTRALAGSGGVLETDAVALPPELRRDLVRAERRLRAQRVLAEVRAARRLWPRDSATPPEAELESLARATPLVLEIDRGLQRLGEPAALGELAALDAARAVDEAWEALATSDRYGLSTGAWRCDPADAPRLFPTGRDIQTFVDREREALEAAHRQVASLLDLAAEGRSEHAGDWRELGTALATPTGGPVRGLERLLIDTVPRVGRDTYLVLLAPGDDASGYFGRRATDLRGALEHRCAHLDLRAAREAADTVRATATTTRNRFPLGPLGTRPGTVSDVRRHLEAVRDFDAAYASLQVARGAGRPIPGELRELWAETRTASTWVPLLDPEAPRGLGAQVAGELVRDAAGDRGTRAIIEARILVGDLDAHPTPAPWVPGDPVAVTLRWARDASVHPLASPTGTYVLDDRTARFQWEDGWALLEALRRHGRPQDPGLLALRVATSEGPASVFVRLRVRSRDGVPVPMLPDADGAVDVR